jgi:hypothetical protein
VSSPIHTGCRSETPPLRCQVSVSGLFSMQCAEDAAADSRHFVTSSMRVRIIPRAFENLKAY